MIRLICNENGLNVVISKEEKITFMIAKRLLKRSRRMIQQNSLSAVIVEIDSEPRIDKSALEFINRVLCYNSSFPVAVINPL